MALMSVRVRVDEQTVLVPDLCVAHRTIPREDVIITPPELCVEILDEEHIQEELSGRIGRFLRMGVKNVWIIDVSNRRGYSETKSGIEDLGNGVLRAGDSDIDCAAGCVCGVG